MGQISNRVDPIRQKEEEGRPRARWSDDITKITGTMWERVAYNRSGWLAAGEAYAQNCAG